MRKIKIQATVPSWNFCNYDGFTYNNRPSKELCKYCVKTKTGYHCSIFDEQLATEPNFVCKTKACIRASAGYQDEPQQIPTPTVDPKFIAKETIKQYNKAVSDLLKQRYPRYLAETLAEQAIIGD